MRGHTECVKKRSAFVTVLKTFLWVRHCESCKNRVDTDKNKTLWWSERWKRDKKLSKELERYKKKKPHEWELPALWCHSSVPLWLVVGCSSAVKSMLECHATWGGFLPFHAHRERPAHTYTQCSVRKRDRGKELWEEYHPRSLFHSSSPLLPLHPLAHGADGVR